MPAFFIPNRGQAAPEIRYMVQTPGLTAGFGSTSAVLQVDSLALRIRFVGANPEPSLEGVERLDATANFLLGQEPQNWKTNLPVYQKILYKNLYPGIDMTYSSAGHRIKSESLLAAGADPSNIRLEYSTTPSQGARKMSACRWPRTATCWSIAAARRLAKKRRSFIRRPLRANASRSPAATGCSMATPPDSSSATTMRPCLW